MTLTIHLPDDKEATLKAKAQARGVSAEHYAAQILDRELEEEGGRRPVSTLMREIWGDLPEDARAKLPADGASQIDHYVYGVPKRDR